MLNIHNQLDHDDRPTETEVPVEPVKIRPARTNDTASATLFPQPPKAQNVLHDADTSQCGRDDGEDGIGG